MHDKFDTAIGWGRLFSLALGSMALLISTLIVPISNAIADDPPGEEELLCSSLCSNGCTMRSPPFCGGDYCFNTATCYVCECSPPASGTICQCLHIPPE